MGFPILYCIPRVEKFIDTLEISEVTQPTVFLKKENSFYIQKRNIKKPFIALLKKGFFNVQVWNLHYCRKQSSS